MRRLFLLSVILLLAASAFGQAPTLGAGAQRVMRGEGTTEAIPAITLTFAAGATLANSNVTLVFSAPVAASATNNNWGTVAAGLPAGAVVSSASGAGVVQCSNIQTNGNTAPAVYGAEAGANCAATPNNVASGGAATTHATVSTTNGSPVVTIIFDATTPVVNPAGPLVGITIQNLRLDVSGVSSASPAVSASITGAIGGTIFSGSVPLGLVVRPSFGLTASVPVGGTGTARNGALSISTCGGPGGGNVTATIPGSGAGSSNTSNASNFYVQIAENFAQAFTSQSDEIGFTPAIKVLNGTQFLITLSGVPAGVSATPFIVTSATIQPGSNIAPLTPPTGTTPTAPNPNGTIPATSSTLFGTSAGGTTTGILMSTTSTTAGSVQLPQRVTSTGSDIVYLVEIGTDSQTTLESMSIGILFSGSPSSASQASITSTLTMQLAPTAAPALPRFAAGSLASSSLTILSGGTCTSALLFPFVVSGVAFNGFDTSIAMANTSLTPGSSYGRSSNTDSGPCFIVGFNVPDFNGGAGVATTAVTTPSIAPGGLFAASLTDSRLANLSGANGFAGYVFALCQFRFVHGFAFITNNLTGPATVSMGYLPLVISGEALNN